MSSQFCGNKVLQCDLNDFRIAKTRMNTKMIAFHSVKLKLQLKKFVNYNYIILL